MNENWISLGRCTRVHGIRGEFLWMLENTDDSVLADGTQVLVRPLDSKSCLSPEGEMKTIKSIRFGNKTIVALEGESDRNDSEAMIPFEIYFDRELFPELEEGEIYLTDLIGLEVLDHNSRKIMGNIESVYESGAHPILRILLKKGEVIEVPFVDAFVPFVDIESGVVEVNPPVEV